MTERNPHLAEQEGQSHLIKSRQFLPLFLTQFLGAFNDNIYKNSLMLLVTYYAAKSLNMEVTVLLNIAAGLFILPFFLFSGIAGEIADKYEKSLIIRKVKLLEIAIMLLGAFAFWNMQWWWLFIILFLMGTQSTLFGPVKYAILPEHLKNEELVGGNAIIEMGTFVAILMGTMGASMIMDSGDANQKAALIVVIVAILGYLSCRYIPIAPAPNPELKINFNPFTTTAKVIHYAREDRAIYLAIMAISWFWFIGATYLTQFPAFAKSILGGDASVVSLLLVVFTIGIAVGSLLCDRLSGHKIELGIVPIGSLGLTISGIDLYFATPLSALGQDISWQEFIQNTVGIHILLDLVGIGIFGGLFIVPLYAFIQQESKPDHRARIIAANNVLNAMFMVVSAVCGIIMLGFFKLSIPEFFLVVAIMNLVIAGYVFHQVPLFALRFIIWMLSHTMYRVKHYGLQNIPDEGAAVLVCNHVSYVDALLIAGSCRRPIRFVMDAEIFKSPFLGWFFKTAQAIPITSKHQNEKVYMGAFDKIAQALNDDELVCIFPEGKLTRTGEINEFKTGIEKIIERTPVPVVPMALQGLWGSFFSHEGGKALAKRPKRFWSRVHLICDSSFSPKRATAVALQEKVLELRGNQP
jgi:1-acyl-sn-glycerol-3-phosphate acyltransferase